MNEIEIFEMGLATAMGSSVEATLAALNKARSAYFSNPSFVGSDFKKQVCAFRHAESVGSLKDRVSALAEEAIDDLFDRLMAARKSLNGPIDVIINLPEVSARDGISRTTAERIATELADSVAQRLAMHRVQVRRSRSEFGGAAYALGAMGTIEITTLMLCADSYSDRKRLTALSEHDLLFSFQENPYGLVPGEAAAAVLIIPGTTDAPFAHIFGVGEGAEPIDEFDQQDSIFTGTSDAAFLAFRDDPTPVNCVITDWNGSRYRAAQLSYTLHRISRDHLVPGTEPESPAPAFGDCGAAFLGVAMLAVHRQVVGRTDGVRALILAGSPASRRRAALVLE
ncbi:MAG: hypothetical protein V3W41_00015 [Planctomycetota bacterium]